MFSQDFKELLFAFNEHRVKYLVVGGYAVAVHAQPRATKDLDLFIQPNPENAKAVFAALTQFGAPLAGVQPEDFIDPDSFFRIGAAPQMIEILPRISAVDFDLAWERRLEIVIDESTGLKVCFISADDFVANKLAVARAQDIADAEAVQRATELRSHIGQVKPTDQGDNDPQT